MLYGEDYSGNLYLDPLAPDSLATDSTPPEHALTWRFVLPWPPSVNGRMNTYRGVQYLTKQYRQKRAALVAAIRAQTPAPHTPLTEPLYLEIFLQPMSRRRTDIDNRIKPILDAFTEAKFWLDDVQVKRLLITEGGIVKGGRALVNVQKLI